MEYSDIICRIEEELKEKNIHKPEFFKAIGISNSLFSLWKYNKSVPQIPKLEEIADYLKVPLQWLMFGDVEETAPSSIASIEVGTREPLLSSDEWALIAAYRSFDEDGKRSLQDYVFMMQKSGIYDINAQKNRGSNSEPRAVSE